VAAGDQDAFDAFFREYFPRLFRFILSRVDNDADLAKEIVQRTMCIVVRKMGSYRGEALLFTWLCQICRNETSAVFRQRKLEVRADIPIEDHPAVQAALESVMADDYRPESARRRLQASPAQRNSWTPRALITGACVSPRPPTGYTRR
jgi:RNA polymerase sigma-70 factor (ECF subfamily)